MNRFKPCDEVQVLDHVGGRYAGKIGTVVEVASHEYLLKFVDDPALKGQYWFVDSELEECANPW